MSTNQIVAGVLIGAALFLIVYAMSNGNLKLPFNLPGSGASAGGAEAPSSVATSD